MKKTAIFFIFLCLVYLEKYACAREIHWDWSKIDSEHIWFPMNFTWGCADSAIQTEGLVTAHGKMAKNSWSDLEEMDNRKVRVGAACERWTRFREDFKLIKQVGMNAHRFSVDWSKLEPEEGKFDEGAFQHYQEVIDCLLELKLEPFLTLFHHIAPTWFMEKGGFEFPENNVYFVRFAIKVFERFHEKVRYWIIFNEPVAYAFEAYFRERYPPRKRSLGLAGKVTLNQLNAHVEVAKEFRKIDKKARIGIAHMSHPIDGYSRWNPFEKSITKLFSALMNESTIQFFKTGRFRWVYPWASGINSEAPGTLDFFGINYYTHTTIKQISWNKLIPCTRPDEIIIDDCGNPERCKVMYPEGLYRSIKRASKLGLPIYITENGVAMEDPAIKDEYIKKHLYVVSRCLAEGFDIRGYFFWAITDCFSWNKGFENKHGIFAVNFETQERTYRPACDYLINTINKFSKHDSRSKPTSMLDA